MADETSNPVISVRVAGRVRRLATSKQWRSAIANGELTRTTPVLLDRGPERQIKAVAGEIEELSDLFDELVGPAAPPPPPPPPPPSPPPPPPADDGYAAAAPAADPPRSSDRRPWDPPADQPPPPASPEVEEEAFEPVAETREPPAPMPPASSGGSKAPIFIGGGLLLVAVFGFMLANNGGNSGSSADSADMPMAEDSKYSERFWAPRELLVRASKSTSATVSGRLSRGDQVFATPAVGGWVELSTGGFIRADELLTAPPPELDRSTADDYFTVEAVDALDAPNTGGETAAYIEKMKKVSVLGTVNRDYAELVTESGKVAYLPWQSLGGVGGKGRSAWIVIENRCSTTKNIAFSLVVDGRRSDITGYWTFAPGFYGPLEYKNAPGQRIYVNSVYNYFADLGDNFFTLDANAVRQVGDDKVNVNGQSVEMKRLVPEYTSDGAYQVTFCNK
jgi:hypothetical protein